MKLLLGLAVTATFLAGCIGTSNDDTTSTPADPITPTVVTDTPSDPEASPVVIGTPGDPVTPPEVIGRRNAVVAPPIITDTPRVSVAARAVTSVIGNISSASFDNDAGTLAVQIALDGSDTAQQYVYAGTVNGYSLFQQQDDPLDREFNAFARESGDGRLQAVVVMDGGQFNTFLGGGSIIQNSYTPVTTGLASFAGNYVGLTNVGPSLVTANGADPSLVPGSTTTITGTAFINVDFADSKVNGSIYDRVFDPDGAGIDLQTIVLTASDIDANGQFTGSVEFEDLDQIGDYNGTFGGDRAENIASIISLGEDFLDGATIGGVETTQFDDVVGEAEYGVFVLGQCSGGGATCFDAN